VGKQKRLEENMRIKKIALIALAFACMFVLTGRVLAEENVFDITTATTITPDSGNARLLMKPEIGLPDTTIVIDRAILDLWVSPQTEDTTYISIRVYPLTTSWSSEAASWTNPWTNPGGDFDEVNYAEYAISIPGEQNIQVDLTDLAMRWADGRLPYYGFIIDISESSLAGVEFLNENGMDPIARLTISFNQSSTE
jgi:hypothetical protein